MRLKTYRAPDLPGALAMARRELGPSALVLATNEIPGRLGLTQVEVTVAADRPEEERSDARLARLAEEARVSRTERKEPPKPEQPRPRGTQTDPGSPGRRVNRVIVDAVEALVAAGLSRDLATRFSRIASADLPHGPDAASIAAATEHGIGSLVTFASAPVASHVLFLVGPPGCGKTTTAAKLAARAGLDADRPVVFGEADADRIGAAEQARIFSEHIGARFRTIETPEDLEAARRAGGEHGCVVVDTAGVGAADRERLRSLWALRRSAPEADVALLIPAGTHRSDAERILERFAVLRPTCAAFSRVDDGGRVGDLVTALAGTDLPLSFVTNGHRVPDDLQEASPRGLAALMLRSGRGKGRAALQETRG